jgi:hypothetical protein
MRVFRCVAPRLLLEKFVNRSLHHLAFRPLKTCRYARSRCLQASLSPEAENCDLCLETDTVMPAFIRPPCRAEDQQSD